MEEWLDDSTVVLLAGKRASDAGQADLLTCTLPVGSCEVAVAGLGTFEELLRRDFALPVGEPIDQ